MINLVFLPILLLISFSLGKWILSALKFELEIFLEKFCFAVGIGLGILAYAVFFLGIFGLLYRWVMYALLISLLLLSLGNVKTLFLNLRSAFEKIKNLRIEKFLIIVGILLAVHLLISLICSLAPVTECDPQMLHLAVPKIYIQHHSIIKIPSIISSDWPLLIQMLYMLGMLLHSDTLANLIQWLITVITLLSIFMFARKFFSAKVGILAMAVFFSCTLVSLLSPGATIDIPLCFFTLLALYGFIEWFLYDRREMFMLSAITSGLAACTKSTALLPLVILLASIGFKLFFVKKENFIKVFKKITSYGSISLLIFIPWIVKNFVYRSNPFYPFFSTFFKSADFAPCLPGIIPFNSFNFFQYLFFPWQITMIGKITSWSDSCGPLYLAFIPILLFIRKKNRIIKYLLIYFFLGMTFFYFFTQSQRYMLPFFVPLAVLVAYAIERLRDSDNWLKKILPAFVIFTMLINLCIFSGLLYLRLPVVLGLETDDHYLGRRIKTYDAIRYINTNLNDDAKILLFDSQGYYCEREYFWGDAMSIPKDTGADELLERYKELGVTHVLVNKAQRQWTKPHRDLAPKHFKVIYEKDGIFVYEIEY